MGTTFPNVIPRKWQYENTFFKNMIVWSKKFDECWLLKRKKCLYWSLVKSLTCITRINLALFIAFLSTASLSEELQKNWITISIFIEEILKNTTVSITGETYYSIYSKKIPPKSLPTSPKPTDHFTALPPNYRVILWGLSRKSPAIVNIMRTVYATLM